MTSLAELVVGGSCGPWVALGLPLGDDGSVTIGPVRLCFDAAAPAGLWSLGIFAGPDPLPDEVDGVALHAAEPPEAPELSNPLGAIGVDHVVVSTPDLDRTVAAITTGLGVEPRRTRTEPTGSGDRLHQVFFRLGPIIVEVVGPPVPDVQAASAAARLWGLVLLVSDIEVATAVLGPERVGPSKAAVQPGRTIATLRSAAGLGLPVALLSSRS